MNDSFSASSFLRQDQMLGGFTIFVGNLGNVQTVNLEQKQTKCVFMFGWREIIFYFKWTVNAILPHLGF